MNVNQLTEKEREYLYEKIRKYYTNDSDALFGFTVEELEFIDRSAKSMEQKIIDAAMFRAFANKIFETREIVEEIRDMLADTYSPTGKKRAGRRHKRENL